MTAVAHARGRASPAVIDRRYSRRPKYVAGPKYQLELLL
jgi:hypothetical protein